MVDVRHSHVTLQEVVIFRSGFRMRETRGQCANIDIFAANDALLSTIQPNASGMLLRGWRATWRGIPPKLETRSVASTNFPIRSSCMACCVADAPGHPRETPSHDGVQHVGLDIRPGSDIRNRCASGEGRARSCFRGRAKLRRRPKLPSI